MYNLITTFCNVFVRIYNDDDRNSNKTIKFLLYELSFIYHAEVTTVVVFRLVFCVSY